MQCCLVTVTLPPIALMQIIDRHKRQALGKLYTKIWYNIGDTWQQPEVGEYQGFCFCHCAQKEFMAHIVFQIFIYAFSWSKSIAFQFKFHRSFSLVSIGSGNGLAPNNWQSMAWTNADYFTNSYVSTSPCLNELNAVLSITINITKKNAHYGNICLGNKRALAGYQ